MLTMSMRAQPVRIMISKAYMFEIQTVDEHSFAAVCTSIIVLRDCLPIDSHITARNLITINI